MCVYEGGGAGGLLLVEVERRVLSSGLWAGLCALDVCTACGLARVPAPSQQVRQGPGPELLSSPAARDTATALPLHCNRPQG